MTIRPSVAAALALAAFALGSAGAGPAPERRYVEPRFPDSTGQPPFSGAVRVGDTLYLSGDIGLDEVNEVPADAETEARNVLESMKRRLEAAGMGMDDLVFVQVFCSDVSHYDAFNRVYRSFFTKEFPARAFLGSGTLLFEARFEVQAIAVKR